MTPNEHLIENCLIKFEDPKNTCVDIIDSIIKDPNLKYGTLTVDQVYEVCQYVYRTYIPYTFDV